MRLEGVKKDWSGLFIIKKETIYSYPHGEPGLFNGHINTRKPGINLDDALTQSQVQRPR